MGSASTRLLTPRAALVLGRVSNLPTVLSNALAGIAVVSAGSTLDAVLPATLVLALLYIGGMYLNDAFDAGIDAVERPQRPIPSGNAARWLVFVLGFALLAAGIGGAAAVNSAAGWVALILAAVIVLYDVTHKHTVLAPVIMGACRLFAYATAAAVAMGPAVGEPLLWLAAAGLCCHVVGLTYAAKREAYNSLGSVWPLAVLTLPVAGLAVAGVLTSSLLSAVVLAALAAAMAVALLRLARRAPGDVPKAVGLLIAAIALYDAGVMAACGAPLTAVALAFLCFPLTLAAQRIVPGT